MGQVVPHSGQQPGYDQEPHGGMAEYLLHPVPVSDTYPTRGDCTTIPPFARQGRRSLAPEWLDRSGGGLPYRRAPLQEKVRWPHQQEEQHPKDAKGVPPADRGDEPLGQWEEDDLPQGVAGIRKAQHPAAVAWEPG